MKITPYRIGKGIRYFRHYGWKAFFNRLRDKMEPEDVPYGPWLERHKASGEELARQKGQAGKFACQPLVSIVVPCYKTPEQYLREMMDSVRAQSYGKWQLCLADATPSDELSGVVLAYCKEHGETRISYRRLGENRGIAENANAGAGMASGDWIGFLDHDDLLAPDALYEVVVRINREPEAEAVYSDEDQVEETRRGLRYQNPHFKPDFNLDLLRSNNYVTHFFCVSRRVWEATGGFRPGFDGAQDHDLILRCAETAKKIAHVPKVLYHWRVHGNSTADNPFSKMYAYDAGKRAVEEHLARMGQEGEVRMLPHLGFYRVKYAVQGEPLVTVLIPNKDQVETLRRCIASIQASSYRNYEIVIIENNSSEPETFAYYRELIGAGGTSGAETASGMEGASGAEGKPDADGTSGAEMTSGMEGTLPGGQPVRVVVWEGGFNYSAINNFGASYASGEYFILLNNDIEIITKDWIEEMLGFCQRPEVGIVGARLYYPDDTVQHAGIVVGIDGIAANMFPGLRRGQEGYFHKAALQLDYSAVTAACMMVSREAFTAVGGLEEKLAVAFNDVDFCLRVGREGYLVAYDPFVEAYHYESKSRGTEDTKEKVRRFGEEIEFFRSRWIELLKEGDPYYNVNFSLKKCNYSIKP